MTPAKFVNALVGSNIPTGSIEFYQKIQEICAEHFTQVRIDYNIGRVSNEFCGINLIVNGDNKRYLTMMGKEILVTPTDSTNTVSALIVVPGKYGSAETGWINVSKKDLLFLDMDEINSWSNEHCKIHIEKGDAGYQLFVEFQDVIMTSNVGITHFIKQIEVGAQILPLNNINNVKMNYCKRNPKLRTKLENAQGFIHGHFHGSDRSPFNSWCYGSEDRFQGFRIKSTKDVDTYITEMRRFIGYESNNPYGNNIKTLYDSAVAVLSSESNVIQGRVDFFDNDYSTVELKSILRTVLEPQPMKAVKIPSGVTAESTNEMAQFELFKKEKVVLV